MVVIFTRGPELVMVPVEYGGEQEERSTLPKASIKELMVSSGYNPKVINLFEYPKELSTTPRWDRLNGAEKGAMFMDKFETELSKYDLEERVAVLGFFTIFTDRMREEFLSTYNANVYLAV